MNLYLKLIITSILLITIHSVKAETFGLIPSESVGLYPDINYGGDPLTTRSNLRDLRLITGNRNDTISSISVPQECIVTLYEHIDFKGRSEVFGSISDPDLRDNIIGNDVVSSIKINCDGGDLSVFPPSGSQLVTSQNIDLVIVVKTIDRVRAVGIHQAKFDNQDVTKGLNNCVKIGVIAEDKGRTYRCVSIPVKTLGAGVHFFDLSVDLSNGRILTSRVKWNILKNTEN